MKVNLKKLGAIVAGATILASSVAFAGALVYGDTTLINENGAPQVKIVVGEKAAASDGVAAANIAAKIASKAYSTKTYTASYTGTATPKGGTGSGTVVLTDKACKLQITVPEQTLPGTYTWSNLLGDRMDRTLLDRGQSSSNYSMNTSETSEFANPFTNGNGGSLDNAPSETYLYKIGGDQFEPLKIPSDSTLLKDSYASKTYTEEQNLWILGSETYAYYDGSEKELVSKFKGLAYTVKFGTPSEDFGIPVCAKVDSGTNYANCSDSQKTAAHKVKIRFLGSDWVISEMTPPSNTTEINNEKELSDATSSVTLAKESLGGVIKKGESLVVDGYNFTLQDVEVAGERVSAAIAVTDAAGKGVAFRKIHEGETEDIAVGDKTYRVHVYQAVGGLTWAATWADMAIYAKEMKLESGKELPDAEKNKGWKVVLGWKNKGGSDNDKQPDHLRTIIVYSDEELAKISNSNGDYLKKGEYISIPTEDPVWQLSYDGLTLKSTDYDMLTFKVEGGSSGSSGGKTLKNVDGNPGASCVLQKPYITITSSTDKAFEGDDFGVSNDQTVNDNLMYLAVSGVSGDKCDDTYTDGGKNDTIVLFMKESPSSDSWYGKVIKSSNSAVIKYSLVGDGSADTTNGGALEITADDDKVGANVTFTIYEKAGTGVSEDAVDTISFVYLNGTKGFANDKTNKKDGEVIYNATGMQDVGYKNESKEEHFITERGSEFVSGDKDEVTFSMAKKLGKAQYTLKSLQQEATTTSGIVRTLKEGESYTLSDGTTIKVLEVQATGTCAAGTGAAPTCDMSGVSAVIMPDNKASVDAAVPYAYSGYAPLVKLDSEALDTETVITVGGPAVNKVTAGLLTPEEFNAAAVDGKVVKEVVKGKKIVVAGITAEDTLKAAADFIAALG